MSVNMISRQFGSHGDAAQLLCDQLGCRYFNQALMPGLAAAVGMAPERVADLEAEKYRAQSLMEMIGASA